MEDKIIDENLLRVIKLKLCTTPLKSYKNIEELNITNKNFLGNTLNINLNEIVKLEKLKTLSLKFFEITDDIIDSINSLENLSKIEFYMCDFKTTKNMNNNIKDITIYSCKDFKTDIMQNCIEMEKLELTNSGIVDMNKLQIHKNLKIIKIRDCLLVSLPIISRLEELEYMYINNIDIETEIDIHKMKNLKFISFSGSKIQNKEAFLQKLKEQNSNLEIECREKDLPIE